MFYEMEVRYSRYFENTRTVNDFWRHLFRLVKENQVKLKNSGQVAKIAKYFAKRLMIVGCNDSHIISRIVHFYRRWIDSDLGTEATSNQILCRRKIRHIIFPLCYPNTYIPDVTFCNYEKFSLAVDKGDLQYVQVLVKFGIFTDYKPIHHQMDISRAERLLHKCLIYVKLKMLRQTDDRCFSRACNFIEDLRRTNGEISESCQRGFHRIIVLLRVFVALMLERDQRVSTTRYLHCLELYFSTVSEPFVNQEEMKHFLLHLFFGEDNGCTVVNELTDIHRRLFHRECDHPYRPRSLKHLSRCVARQLLRRQLLPLPTVIKRLNVPQVVKELLLGAPEYYI